MYEQLIKEGYSEEFALAMEYIFFLVSNMSQKEAIKALSMACALGVDKFPPYKLDVIPEGGIDSSIDIERKAEDDYNVTFVFRGVKKNVSMEVLLLIALGNLMKTWIQVLDD